MTPYEHDGKGPDGESDSEPRLFVASDGETKYWYCDIADDAVCLCGCESAALCVAVPSHLAGKVVREVGSAAFSQLGQVQSLELPPLAEALGGRVLEGCKSLRRVVFPEALDSFDCYWLRDCPQLEELVFPGLLEKVPAGLFGICRLRALTIGRAAQQVPAPMFAESPLLHLEVDARNPWLASDGQALFSKDKTRLLALAVGQEKYAVPQGVRTIGYKAFANHAELEWVDLPDSLHEVEEFAFMGSGLRRFEAPGSLRSLGAKAFLRCEQLAEASLNDGLESIGEEAFAHSGISSLVVPPSVTQLGRWVIADTALVASGESPTFRLDPANPVLALDKAGGLYRRTSEGLVFEVMVAIDTREYEVAAGTVALADACFLRHKAIEAVHLPAGLASIGADAFRGCLSLRQVEVPETLRTIGEKAFFESGLQEIDLPAGFERLGKLALTTGGASPQSDAVSLRRVNVHPACQRYFFASGLLCERTDDGTSRVVLYVGPDDVVSLPEGTTSIAPYAFAGAKGLRELRMNANLAQVGAGALAASDGIEVIRLTLPRPERGQTSVKVRLPGGRGGKRAIMLSFQKGAVDVEALFYYADKAMFFYSDDIFKRASWALERLTNPVFLDEGNRACCEGVFTRNLTGICSSFARRGYTEGFDRLADLSYLNRSNITEVVDLVNKAGDVAMTGYLLEMKHRRFGGALLDFDL